MNTRTTYRTLPVYYSQRWRWFWSYDHIYAVRAYVTQRECDALRRNLASAPKPEVAQ